jgi:hypothetical protein
MGTTLVAALDIGEELLIASVGDSRAYLLDSDSFRAVTEDQSWVNEVGRPLGLDETALRNHPLRNVLTMAIGASSNLVVNCYNIPWKPGSLALLSSDGLHGVIGREEMEQIIRAEEPLEAKCRRFIKAAREAGAPDNVTAVLPRVRPDRRRYVQGPGRNPRRWGLRHRHDAAGVPSPAAVSPRLRPSKRVARRPVRHGPALPLVHAELRGHRIYWLGHHTQFHYVLHVDRTLLWINIFFLMFIATLPFSTAVLGRYGHYQPAVFLYSGNLLLVGWLNATHWAYVTRRRRLVAPDLPADFVRITMARILTTPVVALVSVAVSYINVTWAIYFYYAIVIFYVLLARVRSHSSPGGDTI